MLNTILIVDDERGIRETLRGVLEDEGFEVETVASGEDCLKVGRERIISRVFCWISGFPELTVWKL